MCGIAGEVSYSHSVIKNKDSFLKMQKVLEPRGPDQNGIIISDNVALIHSRLAVIDIENGVQPMTFKQGQKEFTIVYNGELYNTDEIKNELLLLGHSFSGYSDTEVVLKSYIQWQENCLEKFNGIFSFAIWDKFENHLFFARDRMGVKPFFYTVKNNSFIFGSEIKAILEHNYIEPIINEKSIAEIMYIGPGRTPGCGVFKDIYELKPACWGVYSKSGIKIRKYWTLKDCEHNDSLEETADKIRYLVNDAITRQLVSDVPIGTFLSGGLDSSIISSIANKYLKNKNIKLNTFSVTYENNDIYFKSSKFQPNSDTEYIKKMVDYLDCEQHLITLSNESLAEALTNAVDARDLPGMADVDSSLLLFCKEIKKHCTVALSGECADEIFGGYPWYRDKKIRATNGFPWSQSIKYRKMFIRDDIRIPACEDYVYSRYKDTMINTSKVGNLSPIESRMREMMKLNIDWFMQTLLDRKDRMSMYNGLEVRVPFCDYRIAEYLYSVPWEYKNYNNFEKGLLRKAMEGILPDEILWRKKSPYPKTHNPVYLKIVSDMLLEIINNNSSPIFSFIKKSELEKLIYTEQNEPWYGQLMTTPQTIAYFVQINYWLKKYKIRIE